MDAQTNPVLVGFDGSADAILALEWAASTVKTTGPPLRVVVVSPDPDDLRVVGQATRTVDTAENILSLLGAAGWSVTRRDGSPSEVLRSEAHSASMVVVGSRGHGRVEGRLVGSVSQHLAAHVQVPLVVVRPADDENAQQIVVGVDDSPRSIEALRFAAERATHTGEAVLVVHAYEYPTYLGVGRPVAPPAGGLAVDPAHIPTDLDDQGERLAAKASLEINAEFPGVQMRSLATAGRAATVLGRMSEDSSLVVVGAHGRTGLADLALGSTTQQILHGARCPVAVVH